MTLAIDPGTQTVYRVFASPTRPRGVSWWPSIALWRERRRTRRELSLLDDRLLADIGLTPAQRRQECAKPFWLL